jgi:hypothetical protein
MVINNKEYINKWIKDNKNRNNPKNEKYKYKIKCWIINKKYYLYFN